MNKRIAAQVGREAEGQALLDVFYRERGYVVDRSVAGKRYDLELERDGRRFAVEEKIRSAAYDDVLVEIVQDIGSGNPGWFYTEDFDYLVYAVVAAAGSGVAGAAVRRVTILDWPRFRKWLYRVYLDGGKRPACRVSTEGYGVTVNLVIPVRDIPPSYMKVFAGDPAGPSPATNGTAAGAIS